jgi:hypothetical protein
MVRDDSNTENENSFNSESEEVEEESETGYSTGTGSSTSESVPSTSRRTTTEEGDEEEEDTTETSAADDSSHKETVQPVVIAPPIQPFKVTSIAKTEDARASIQLQQNESQSEKDKPDRPQSPHFDQDALKSEPPPILYDDVRADDVLSENDDVSNIAITNSNANTETKHLSRAWLLPFKKTHRIHDQHERLIPDGIHSSTNLDPVVIQEYIDPEHSSKIMKVESGSNDSSPSRTVTMSDSGTPDRLGTISTVEASSSTSTRNHGKTTKRM